MEKNPQYGSQKTKKKKISKNKMTIFSRPQHRQKKYFIEKLWKKHAQ
jgi:hypothetical protein